MMNHEARDGERVLVFRGVQIGFASSEEPGKERWTEAKIFRTAAGNYVVEIVGRSTHYGEVDRSRAHVCETARGAVESLYIVDDDTVRYIPRVNKEAGEDAARNDAEFAEAFFREEVA
jgi:hypothetical protein